MTFLGMHRQGQGTSVDRCLLDANTYTRRIQEGGERGRGKKKNHVVFPLEYLSKNHVVFT